MQRRIARRHNSDAHYSVLADLLFSILMASVALISERHEVIEMSVATAETSEAKHSAANSDPETIVIQVSQDGQLKVNDQILTLDAIMQSPAVKGADKSIVLRVAPECRHQTVFSIYHRIRKAGLSVVEEGLLESKNEVPHE